jgi:glycosyltransferase involved in cell wall biosynthesis
VSLLYAEVARHGYAVDEFTRAGVVRRRYDIVHVHWPNHALPPTGVAAATWRGAALLTSLALARFRGARVVWTVHEIEGHELTYPSLEPRFWRIFTALVDGLTSPSEGVLQAAFERFPRLRNVPAAVIPHGHFRSEYANTISREDARASLGVSEASTVFVYLGLIRPYKNVPSLIRAFASLADPDAVLVVAGKPHTEATAAELRDMASDDPRVRLELRWIENEEVQRYLGAADLVVLPFAEIYFSGSTLLALSFNRPVLVPAAPALVEIQRNVGKEWVTTYEGDIDAETLVRGRAATAATNGVCPLDAYEWETIGEETVAFYRQLVAAKGR